MTARPPPLSKTTYMVDFDPPESAKRLLAEGSRWKGTSGKGKRGPAQPGNRYNLLLYLKGISEDQDALPLLRSAYTGRKNLGKDYVVGNSGLSETRLQGNDNAAALIAEWDAVIELARGIWHDPNVLEDWITHMFYDHFRGRILKDDATKVQTMERILRWSDRWAEVRYRYLNHYLRDDPDNWERLEERQLKEAGDHANEIVHSSSLQDDCQLAESHWFVPEHRALFFDVYKLGVREARRLVDLSNWGNLSGIMRGIFTWTIDFINRYIKWREGVMRSATREHLNEARRNRTGQSNQARNAQRTQMAAGLKASMRGTDDAYRKFLDVLRVLMQEGRDHMNLSRETWENFLRMIDTVTHQLRACSLNRTNPNRSWDIRLNWPKDSSFDNYPLRPRGPNIGHLMRVLYGVLYLLTNSLAAAKRHFAKTLRYISRYVPNLPIRCNLA
ncbi:hypothetical protein F4811DRAFT_571480 [Daldinia bambusicola]|nr:hypothetical protein F4811DRAFT_571480 [Daldinia bambusicola]